MSGFRLRSLVPFAFAALATAALAQYTGPSDRDAPRKEAGTARTVAEIREDARDDRPVLLRGVLERKLGKERYLFRDSTGTIRVEIDDEDFPQAPVDEKTVVEIAGKVDKDWGRAPEVDARRVRAVD